jgi:toxin-antitoxin system PIN domain toxin
VLVFAHRPGMSEHEAASEWLDELISSDAAFSIPDLVLSGFTRIVTHPGAFAEPTDPQLAMTFCTLLREHPHHVVLQPGPRHWDIFKRLVFENGARGNLVPDAYLAALAIEAGSEWITTDHGFSRWPGLRWRNPLR